MLQWVGKRPLDYVTAFPAQEIERFDPAATLPSPLLPLLPSPSGGGAGGGVGPALPRRQQRRPRLAAGARLPRQGQPGLHRPAVRQRRRLRAPGATARPDRRSQTGRRDLHPGRADPVHRHLGQRHLFAVHVRAVVAVEGVAGARMGASICIAIASRSQLSAHVSWTRFLVLSNCVNEIVWQRLSALTTPSDTQSFTIRSISTPRADVWTGIPCQYTAQ